MAKLYFRYGAMNSGKSTALLQVAHNYHERGLNCRIIKPDIDSKGQNSITSRVGLAKPVDHLISQTQNIIDQISPITDIDCLLVDEVQFLTPTQIDQLYLIATQHNVPVICYGLRVDFQTKAFPASIRLFELAHQLEELKTICRCGKKAQFNARLVNGQFTMQGQQVAIDGQADVSYESVCGHCYQAKVGPISQTTIADLN